jgi:predicted dehydrogenase
MEKIRFGVIGCGLMGREFASAAGRWSHLSADIPAPEIIAVCDTNEALLDWYGKNVPSVRYSFSDYREMLALEEVDAVYCAVPHHLHEEIYTAVVNSGKHLLGEKPFGIDINANRKIMEAVGRHPGLVVRCASEFPFYPGANRLVNWVRGGGPGKIIEVRAGLKHSSDLNIHKQINWKRMVKFNGEYGCMGDLGIHTHHIPFRMGWIPERVYAQLSDIGRERPDAQGESAPCETWDNAVLMCDVRGEDGGCFPMVIENKRIAPGSTNEWYIEVYGMKQSAKFSTNDPCAFSYTENVGSEQAWCRVVIGYTPQIPTITGGIFEFGFTDSILQMWGAYMSEIAGKPLGFTCFRPEETVISHRLCTAALASAKSKRAERLDDYK